VRTTRKKGEEEKTVFDLPVFSQPYGLYFALKGQLGYALKLNIIPQYHLEAQ
jgi:hypothetical protein